MSVPVTSSQPTLADCPWRLGHVIPAVINPDQSRPYWSVYLKRTVCDIENGHRNSWFTHWTWWFSIVFCMFTRGYPQKAIICCQMAPPPCRVFSAVNPGLACDRWRQLCRVAVKLLQAGGHRHLLDLCTDGVCPKIHWLIMVFPTHIAILVHHFPDTSRSLCEAITKNVGMLRYASMPQISVTGNRRFWPEIFATEPGLWAPKWDPIVSAPMASGTILWERKFWLFGLVDIEGFSSNLTWAMAKHFEWWFVI